MEFIRGFKDINKNDIGIAGGKGASLGEMMQASIPIPDGFVILSNSFEEFIKENDLNIEIDAILDKVDTERIHTVEETALFCGFKNLNELESYSNLIREQYNEVVKIKHIHIISPKGVIKESFDDLYLFARKYKAPRELIS